MDLQQRISAFAQLGKVLHQLAEQEEWQGYDKGVSQTDHDLFKKVIHQAQMHNAWFTEVEIKRAIRGLASWLSQPVLQEWVSKYDLEGKSSKHVAVIMAGNIPLVGFHDVLSVLLSGHSVLCKMSSEDDQLLPWILHQLMQIEPAFNDRIRMASGKLQDFDAVIATGSNNSARYFEQYFGKYPHIIRKNRTSVAILDGSETDDELKALGHDIFDYYGLGCRNVGKILLPEGMDLNRIIGALFSFQDIINHNKYANNYDYHKALYLLNREELLENGFLLFKEDERLHSPLAVLFYHRYGSKSDAEKWVQEHQEQIQCVVGHSYLPFGTTQQPGVSDYADGVDTLQFLAAL